MGKSSTWVDAPAARMALWCAWVWAIEQGHWTPADATLERGAMAVANDDILDRQAAPGILAALGPDDVAAWRRLSMAVGPGVRGLAKEYVEREMLLARFEDTEGPPPDNEGDLAGLWLPASVLGDPATIQLRNGVWEVSTGHGSTNRQRGHWRTQAAALAAGALMRPHRPPALAEASVSVRVVAGI